MTSNELPDPVSQVLDRLQNVRKSGGGWTALCPAPAHDDRTASLSIGVGDADNVLLKCFAGCSVPAIVEALGLQLKDLFVQDGASTSVRHVTALQTPGLTL